MSGLRVLLLLLAAAAPPVAGGQDAEQAVGAPAAATSSVETALVAPPGNDPPAEIDPSIWTHPGDGSPRDWLGLPHIDAADLAARPGAYAEMLDSHGIALDLDAGTVAVRGATLWDNESLGYPIEYLVVTELGRTHEAAVIVRAQPSVLLACLRAIGLAPGASTSFTRKDPPPTEEEYARGASEFDVTPAYGPLVAIRVSWVDDGGAPHDESLEALLIDLHTGESIDEQDWIFTGSRFGRYRQGREWVEWFKADVEGDVVAIYLSGTAATLFERNSLDGLAGLDSLYTLHPDVAPARGTPVTLHFSASHGLPVPPRGTMPLDVFVEPDPLEPEGATDGEPAPGGDEEG